MTEQLLKEQVLANLADDFEILEEISGFHPIYKKRVRIDLLVKAKQHLVNEGFTDQWFGIECKWSEGVCGQTSKITRMVWQSITYAQSTFEVGEERVIPRFVAVFTPDNLPPTIDRLLSQLLGLGLYGCVGKLYFYRDSSWGIKFASIYGRSSPEGYRVNQKQLPKLRAGSV
jgi:hypothetical protein